MGKCLFVGKSTSQFRKLSCFVMLIQHCNQIPTGQALEKASRGAAASSQASSILFELLSSGKKMQSHKMQIELLQELICCCLLLTALEAWISRSSISPQGACFNSQFLLLPFSWCLVSVLRWGFNNWYSFIHSGFVSDGQCLRCVGDRCPICLFVSAACNYAIQIFPSRL